MLLGLRARITYQPKGVCLIIAPWNFPFLLAIGPLISAIAAGNVVIIKPSEMTPHTSELIVSLVTELFNKEEVAVVEGDYKIAEELLTLPFDHVFFTGSPANGQKVMRAAAEHLSSITLELGGKNAAIVDETADLKDAAEKIVWGKFLNGGQSCLSINYLYVHASRFDELLNHIKIILTSVYPPSNSEMACIVNGAHFGRLNKAITDAVSKGATIFSGGTTNIDTRYIEPTILTNVTLDSIVMQEDIFGPVMPILKYEQIEEVITYINRNSKPLALYVFTRNNKFAERVFSETSSGSFAINETTIQFVHPKLPFGGNRASGLGRAHGHAGFLAFSDERPVVRQRRGLTTIKLVYPPYTNFVKRLIDFMIRWL